MFFSRYALLSMPAGTKQKKNCTRDNKHKKIVRRSCPVCAACRLLLQVIMWELWTGEEPHEGEPLHALLHQIMSDSGLTLPIPGTPAWGDAEAPPEPAPGWSDLMQRCWLPPQQRPTARQLITLVEDMMGRLRALRRTSSAATSTQGR